MQQAQNHQQAGRSGAIRAMALATISAALVVGTTVAVAAQDEAEAAEAPFETPVYYTWENGEWADFQEGTYDEEAGTLTGMTANAIPVFASDPRFNARAWVALNGQVQENGDDVFIGEQRSWYIEDDFGCTWTGTSTQLSFGTQPEPPIHHSEAAILDGHGPCEGMTLLATGDYTQEEAYGETIIVGVDLPPLPDAPEPALALSE